MERQSARIRSGRGPMFVLLLAIGAAAVAGFGFTPWVFHIGGRFTPTLTWDGFGTVEASNGARYVLFTDLHGGAFAPGASRKRCTQYGCDTLYGTAKLCSAGGRVESFTLRGKVHGWLHTDGAPTTIDLTGGSPVALPAGWVVAFHGRWDGPVLDLASPDNSFTEIFTRDGSIRRVTSTADAGTASLTLHYGSAADFEQACRALARA